MQENIQQYFTKRQNFKYLNFQHEQQYSFVKKTKTSDKFAIFILKIEYIHVYL